MINHLSSIPRVFRGLMLGALIIFTLRVVQPIASYIIALFPTGNFRTVAILVYWLIIIFVTWFLIWIVVFKPDKIKEGG